MSHRPAVRRRILAVVAATASVAAFGIPALASAGATTPERVRTISDPAAMTALRAQVRNGTLDSTHGSSSPCVTLHLGCRYTLTTASRSSTVPLSTKAPVAWGATELEKAFRLTKAPSRKGTVTLIGIGADPNLESDLTIYRDRYGLPRCTTANGCLTIANYRGGPALQPSNAPEEEDIAVETSLDVQMASAACPSCKITYLGVPVRFGNKQDISAFGTAVQTAVAMGSSSVSISYGFNTNSSIDNGPLTRRMVQPGLGLFSAVGDFGYMDPHTFQTGIGGWPQNLRSVVSVGGTTMTASKTDPTGYAQTAWKYAGSGCAPDLEAAYGQPASIAAYCNGERAVSDVAAVSDNLAVYDSYAPASGTPYGWISVGGTSASSPFLAGMSARAPEVNDALGPNQLYRAPSSAYVDVATGRNGTTAECAKDGVSQKLCKAGTGWDGATGLGIPRGLAPFTSR